jgi:hypothetical protein
MARRLIFLVAVIGLATLVLAPASFAATYDLGIQEGDGTGNVWLHIYSETDPWAAGTEFVAGSPTYYSSEADWRIGFAGTEFQPFTNSSPGTENLDGSYTIVFDTTAANPNFFIQGMKDVYDDDVPDITSNDTTLTYNVSYDVDGDYHIVTSGVIIGTGTNSLDGGTPFMFTAELDDIFGNHQNRGHFKSFTLDYPYDSSAVPIPGAVWLLGTGMLGLWCLGRRRQR